jgi:hypothetical protein
MPYAARFWDKPSRRSPARVRPVTPPRAGLRIHLAALGGGAACGAHNHHARAFESTVLASPIAALVDCRKCRTTTQYRQIFDPPRQYRLRLFAMVRDTEPPRRLSVADISTNPACRQVEITLNGEHQTDVIAYDADAGWAERYVRDERGQYVVKGDLLATERVAGVVEVHWRRAA